MLKKVGRRILFWIIDKLTMGKDDLIVEGEGKKKSLTRTLVTVIIMIIIQPFLWLGVNSAANKFHEDRSQAEQVEDVKKRIVDIEEGLNKQNTHLSQLVVVAPREKDTVRLIESFEALAAERNLEISVESITEEDEGSDEGPRSRREAEARRSAREVAFDDDEEEGAKRKGRFFTMTVALKATGSPSALLDYLTALERMRALVRVDSLRLAQEEVQSSFNEQVLVGRYVLNLEGSVIIQRTEDDEEI